MKFIILSNIQIIDQLTQEVKYNINRCTIKFEPQINFSLIKDGMSNIEIKLNNNIDIILDNIEIDNNELKFENNIKPINIKFDSLINVDNVECLYQGTINNIYKYNLSECQIKMKTKDNSKLILEEPLHE